MAAVMKSTRTLSEKKFPFFLRVSLSSQAGHVPNMTPLTLSEDHLNKLYHITQSEIKSFFPQGLPRKLITRAETLGQVSWILREPSWTVIRSLKEEDSMKNRFMFYGPDRCGKTLCLLQSIHYCLRAGWIVLYIPSVYKWIHSRSELKRHSSQLFDLPEESSLWLQQFKGMNMNQLESLTLSQDYEWTKNDHAKEGDMLTRVIEQGISKPNISSAVFHTVFNEVTQLKSPRVLLAVDDFNGCFSPTSFKEKVRPKDITIIRHLLDFLDPQKFSGPVVTALSKRLMRHSQIRSTDYAPLLGTEGSSLSSTFNPLLVPPYSPEELNLCLESYYKEKWLTKDLSRASKSELLQLSGGIPGELERICFSL